MRKKMDIWSNAKTKQTEEVVRDYEQRFSSKSEEKFPIETDKETISEKKKNSEELTKGQKSLTNHDLDMKLTKLKKTKTKNSTYKKIKKESPFNKKGWTMVVASIIMMVLIIAIPIAFLFGAGTSIITGGKSLYLSNGFISENTDYTFNETKFSLEHVESGEYIDFPYTSVGDRFPLSLTTDDNNYNFSWEGENFSKIVLPTNDLALRLTGKPYFLVPGTTPSLAKEPIPSIEAEPEEIERMEKEWHKRTQVGIYQKGSEDEYAIFSQEQNQFLGNPDENNQLNWSTEPVWWKMKAYDPQSGDSTLLEITTVEEFQQEFWTYEEIAQTAEFVSGISGRTMSIQSGTNDKYLNTETFVDEFNNKNTGDIELRQSQKPIELKNYENSNFFIHNVVDDKIQIGAFANSTVDKRSTTSETTGEDWFPVLVADGNELKLETKENASSSSWDTWTESFITLERNPLNLREFAINFKDIDGWNQYVTTKNDKVQIENGPTVNEPNYIPEYFRFNLSSLNAENLNITLSKSGGTSGTYSIEGQALDNNIYKVKIRARAFATDGTGELLDDTGWKNYKVIGTSATVKIIGLLRETTYNQVEMEIYRDANTANHVTTYLVDGFTTVNWELPEVPETGLPAQNVLMTEKQLALIDNPANNAEIKLEFINGEGLDLVSKITLFAYELDSSLAIVGDPIEESTTLTTNGDKEFIFTDLKPETSYWITTKYMTIGGTNDLEQDDTDGVPEASKQGSDSGTYSMTIKTHRTLPDGQIKDVMIVSSGGYYNLEMNLSFYQNTVHTAYHGGVPFYPMMDIFEITMTDALNNIEIKSRSIFLEDPNLIKFTQTSIQKGDKVEIEVRINMQDYTDDNLIYHPPGIDSYQMIIKEFTVQ